MENKQVKKIYREKKYCYYKKNELIYFKALFNCELTTKKPVSTIATFRK